MSSRWLIDSNLALSRQAADPSPIVIGQSPHEEAANPFVNAHWISPPFFATMRILILAAAFSDDDRANTERVAIVNERIAARLFPGRMIGRRIKLSAVAAGAMDDDRWHLGQRAPQDAPRRPAMTSMCRIGRRMSAAYFVVRTKSNPMTIASALPSIVWHRSESIVLRRPIGGRPRRHHSVINAPLAGCSAASRCSRSSSRRRGCDAPYRQPAATRAGRRIALGSRAARSRSLVFARSSRLLRQVRPGQRPDRSSVCLAADESPAVRCQSRRSGHIHRGAGAARDRRGLRRFGARSARDRCRSVDRAPRRVTGFTDDGRSPTIRTPRSTVD